MHVFAWVLGVCLVCVPALTWASGGTEAEVGKPGPTFRLPVYNAAAVGVPSIGLDHYNGKVVLLSFMASFCKPCKREMPYLQKLYRQYKDKGLQVVMVSIDGEAEGQKQIEDLISTHQITFPVLKDRFQVVGRRWLGAQTPLPSMFLIKPDGTIASVHRGYDAEASTLLASEVESALKASPSSTSMVTAE